MAIELPDDAKKRIHRSLQGYFLDHFEIEIGELQCTLLLEHVLGLIGATVRNQALADAQAYMQGKLIDMEIDLSERVDETGAGPPADA